MQNTQINPSIPAAGSVDSNMTESSMGRLGNFNTGVNGYTPSVASTIPTKPVIKSRIK